MKEVQLTGGRVDSIIVNVAHEYMDYTQANNPGQISCTDYIKVGIGAIVHRPSGTNDKYRHTSNTLTSVQMMPYPGLPNIAVIKIDEDAQTNNKIVSFTIHTLCKGVVPLELVAINSPLKYIEKLRDISGDTWAKETVSNFVPAFGIGLDFDKDSYNIVSPQARGYLENAAGFSLSVSARRWHIDSVTMQEAETFHKNHGKMGI